MANRISAQREAARFGVWLVRDIGRELRVARITAGLRQADVARTIGRSKSYVSRVENGVMTRVGVGPIARHAAAVGMKAFVRLYPAVSRPLDHAQLQLLHAFRDRIGTAWSMRLEVPMPIPGDLRATDAVIETPGCQCAVEAITRLADVQAQVRSARLKARDLGVERLVLLVRGSTTNRRAVQDAGSVLADAFPIRTRAALDRLAAGLDPGGDALILL